MHTKELVPHSVHSTSNVYMSIVVLLTQTRDKEHAWLTVFTEIEGEIILDHCSVRWGGEGWSLFKMNHPESVQTLQKKKGGGGGGGVGGSLSHIF